MNARIDVFLARILAGSREPQGDLVAEAVRRAEAYLEAGADCVYPIAIWEREALRDVIAAAPGPVNVLALPRAPALPELATLGAARVSWGTLLYREALVAFAGRLRSLGAGPGEAATGG